MHSRELLSRHVDEKIRIALSDTRIVAIVGPRQSGKTTIAREIARHMEMSFVTLDDIQSRDFANDDPIGFIRDFDRAVIDEVQRAPQLILAIKKSVDEDPRSGRFLLTGSVDLFTGLSSLDSLAGRVETIELLPLSQTEISHCEPSDFLSRAFDRDFPMSTKTFRTFDLMQRVLLGGYPEVLLRENTQRQRAWFMNYAQALLQRDVAELTQVTKLDRFTRLLEHAAILSSQLLNVNSLSRMIGVDSKTIDRWLYLLEHMFILRRISPWHRNDLKRLVKTPKIHFLDTGLLSALRRVDLGKIKHDRHHFGILLEDFVYSELVKLAAISIEDVRISHYRDKNKIEVDFVLEKDWKVVGIEVKAAATIKPNDLVGLKKLKEAAGNSFTCGIILHDGECVHRVGEQLFAVPVGLLWESSFL